PIYGLLHIVSLLVSCSFSFTSFSYDIQVLSNVDSLNPTVTFSPSVTIGRLINIPSAAKYDTISSIVICVSLSFIFCLLYTLPLVLKYFFCYIHILYIIYFITYYMTRV